MSGHFDHVVAAGTQQAVIEVLGIADEGRNLRQRNITFHIEHIDCCGGGGTTEPDGSRSLEWPSNEFYYWKSPDPDEHDVVLFLGVEPNMKWRQYTNHIADVAQSTDVRLLVTVGALLAMMLISIRRDRMMTDLMARAGVNAEESGTARRRS